MRGDDLEIVELEGIMLEDLDLPAISGHWLDQLRLLERELQRLRVGGTDRDRSCRIQLALAVEDEIARAAVDDAQAVADETVSADDIDAEAVYGRIDAQCIGPGG